MTSYTIFGWWQKHCHKRAGKGSSIVIWDRVDYWKKAKKQLSDKNVYKEVGFKEKMLFELVESSDKFFKNLEARGCISKKNLKYFSYEFKKTSIWVSYFCYLKYKNACQMSLEDQLFQIVVFLLRKYLNS